MIRATAQGERRSKLSLANCVMGWCKDMRLRSKRRGLSRSIEWQTEGIGEWRERGNGNEDLVPYFFSIRMITVSLLMWTRDSVEIRAALNTTT